MNRLSIPKYVTHYWPYLAMTAAIVIVAGTVTASFVLVRAGSDQTAPPRPDSALSQPPGMADAGSADQTDVPGAGLPGSGSPPSQEGPGTRTPVGAPAGGWIPVDQAELAAKTAQFFARAPRQVTGNPVAVPEFHASCRISHHGDDDPIVFPGLAGASHNHTFWGNTTTNAATTTDSLFAATATTCNPSDDKSAYWIPTLYQNGQVVDPIEVTVYYGSRLKDPSRTQPFPRGFRMITGDATKQSDPHGNHFWCAGIGGEIGRTANGEFPVCAPTAHLVRQVTFADCWDGKHLDSPNHKDHVANGNHLGQCPESHPVPIPNISFVIAYPLSGYTEGITLSSGNAVSMHADFFNAWDEEALASRVRNCINQGVKCNAAGGF